MILQENKGISLIELAGALTIAGIVASGYLLANMSPTTTHAEKNKITMSRMAEINKAILLFNKTHERLPCPGDQTQQTAYIEHLNPDNTCQGDIGSIPAFSLHLPEEYMLDGWGRRISYHRSIKPDGDLTIQNLENHKKTEHGIFVLISYGASGAGAYLPSGKQLPPSNNPAEKENSNNDNLYIQDQLREDFDNIVTYMNAAQLEFLEGNNQLASLDECRDNSAKLALMTSNVVASNHDYYVAGLELIWALQDACYQYYADQITRTCPNNVTYDPNSDNPCICDNGRWDGDCKN